MAYIRDVIQSLIEIDLVEMAYYDHTDRPYYFTNRISSEHKLPNYDSNDDFYANFEPCIIFAGSGDSIGSTIDMANRKYIEQEYPELIEQGHIEYHNFYHGYTALIIFFLRLPVARSGIFEDLENLPNYCVLDDELESIVQHELLEEAWDNWLASDFESELEKLTGMEFIETNWQRDLFWEILRNGDGSEYYHPETGENIYVNLEEVFKNKETLILEIVKNAVSLETGEYKVEPIWKQESYQQIELFWEVKPINAPLKNALKSGIIAITPIAQIVSCHNCNGDSVMSIRVLRTDKALKVCPDCYNKLMDYWPKCQQCNTRNAHVSLQYSLSSVCPVIEDTTTLTHCLDCKNLILTAY